MNKMWEENFVTNAIQNKLSLKTEQLRVSEEKSGIQSNLVAVSKRRQNMAEKELAKLQERCTFLSKEVDKYARLLNEDLHLRDDVLTSVKEDFLAQFDSTVKDLTEKLRLNQSGQLGATVQI